MNNDFPITQRIISRLDGWIHRLAKPLGPAHRVPQSGHFRWEFQEKSPRVLIVAKLVRMTSAIRAAMFLADNGYTVESSSLLRLVSDFAQEITAVSAGLLKGELNSAQRKFVDQFFAPLARTPEQLESQARERYVTREELYKASYRLADQTGQDAELFRRISRYLNYGYDKYVHGSYVTAMELYRGDRHEFMLDGVEFEERRCAAKTAIAGKLHEVVAALELFALTQKLKDVYLETQEAGRMINESDEQAGGECKDAVKQSKG